MSYIIEVTYCQSVTGNKDPIVATKVEVELEQRRLVDNVPFVRRAVSCNVPITALSHATLFVLVLLQ